MTSFGFGLLCLISFTLPVPILAWLDRVRESASVRWPLRGGLAIKANQPQAPTWALLLGVGFLDVLFGIFVMLGIERVTVTPGISPGFSLDFIDWSHSLAMSLVWQCCSRVSSGVRPRSRSGHRIRGLLAFSADWPHASARFGPLAAIQYPHRTGPVDQAANRLVVVNWRSSWQVALTTLSGRVAWELLEAAPCGPARWW